MGDRFKILPLLLFLILDSVVTQPVPRLNSSSEWRALLELRSTLGIRAKDWPRKANPCFNWTGIECSRGHVVGIDLAGLRRTRLGKLNPRFAVDALQNFPMLSRFNSSGFSIPGSIPEWFGQRLCNLEVLDLRSCSIYGSIPSSIGSLSRLNSLYLSNNSIAGTVPSELGNLFSLSVLDLSRNLLAGQVPNEISFLGNLDYLDLASNFLSGGIPPNFGSLSRLKILNLSDNSLSGPIPSQLGNLSQLMELNLGHNSLSGSLPRELIGLRNLRRMLIGENELEGSLFEILFENLSQLEYLDVSGNNFVDGLPVSLWSISGLKYLDVSRNNLTGDFPSNFASLNFSTAVFNFSSNMFYGDFVNGIGMVQILDLSSNYFQGSAPNDTVGNVIFSNNCFFNVPDQRNSNVCRRFYTERGLSFENDDVGSPMQEPHLTQSRTNRKRFTYIMIGVFGGLGFIMLLVASILFLLKICNIRLGNRQSGTNRREKGIENRTKSNSDLSTFGDSFTYEQILLATQNFSNENFIKQGHSGDLFRGVLEGGIHVIVKRIDSHSSNTESFMSELDFFSKVSHSRFVPLVGYCLEDEKEKILVYKYMVNRDLSNSFFRIANTEMEELQSLDWITRLKIAIGAAEALSYLHHECSPPYVHRDIQASSILLDDKYEVRLGSLSEVCALGTNGNHSMISRFLRQPQSSGRKPSGSSSVTCAHDVYCFGKVLLELVTGRIGMSRLNDADTKQWLDSNLQVINIHEKELIIKIVDQSLIVDEDLLEEVWAIALVAKSCLNPNASRRPSMRHVLKALENPFKVVREETFSSGSLRRASSTRSWTAAFFGSWRQNSLDSSNVSGQTSREIISGLRQTERIGSRGSGANDHSSSLKRSSSDVFPEPVEMQDVERQDNNAS